LCVVDVVLMKMMKEERRRDARGGEEGEKN